MKLTNKEGSVMDYRCDVANDSALHGIRFYFPHEGGACSNMAIQKTKAQCANIEPLEQQLTERKYK